MRGFEIVPSDWAPASVWYDDDGRRQQTLEFIVSGKPEPQGSKNVSRQGFVYESAKGLKDWRKKVHNQAQAAMNGRWRSEEFIVEGQPRHIRDIPRALPMFNGSVMLDVTYVLYRPKTFSAPPWLVLDKDIWKEMIGGKGGTPPAIKKPDLEKLTRAIKDAMTGVVYFDDSQVIEEHARKRLADVGELMGAHILVTSNVEVK